MKNWLYGREMPLYLKIGYKKSELIKPLTENVRGSG
jgi:hypothetical protein